MVTKIETSFAKDQIHRTETGRDRSDEKPNRETLAGKNMKDTGVSRSITGGGTVPKIGEQ